MLSLFVTPATFTTAVLIIGLTLMAYRDWRVKMGHIKELNAAIESYETELDELYQEALGNAEFRRANADLVVILKGRIIDAYKGLVWRERELHKVWPYIMLITALIIRFVVMIGDIVTQIATQ